MVPKIYRDLSALGGISEAQLKTVIRKAILLRSTEGSQEAANGYHGRQETLSCFPCDTHLFYKK